MVGLCDGAVPSSHMRLLREKDNAEEYNQNHGVLTVCEILVRPLQEPPEIWLFCGLMIDNNVSPGSAIWARISDLHDHQNIHHDQRSRADMVLEMRGKV